jgi:hypothetical protein
MGTLRSTLSLVFHVLRQNIKDTFARLKLAVKVQMQKEADN